jgi:hypothetical protein
MVVKSDITKKNYEGSMRRLRDGLKVPADAGLDFLKDFGKVSGWIDGLQLGISSKKAYYVAIKTVGKEILDATTLKKYDDKFKALAEQSYTEAKKQLTTPAEAEKTMTWAEILAMKSKIEPKEGETNWNIIQDWVIYSLYTMLPPLRADYSPMKFYDTMPRGKQTGNYLVLRKSSPVIVLQDYKTSSKFGTVNIKIPKELYAVLTVWRTFNPSEWLILKGDGEPMTPDNLSQRIIRLFLQHTGKAVGINMLRHAYITMKRSGKELTLLQKEVLARQMLHSTLTNELYRRVDAEGDE